MNPLPPGAMLGILGGGQLGRMSAMAAARLGYRCHIYAPGADEPPTFELFDRGGRKPSDTEIHENPRARSARLRAAERTEAPARSTAKGRRG